MKKLATTKSSPTALRAAGWVSLTYPYRPGESIILFQAVQQLGIRPHQLVTVPTGIEIFVPRKTNKGLI